MYFFSFSGLLKSHFNKDLQSTSSFPHMTWYCNVPNTERLADTLGLSVGHRLASCVPQCLGHGWLRDWVEGGARVMEEGSGECSRKRARNESGLAECEFLPFQGETERFSQALQYLWGGPPKHSIQLFPDHTHCHISAPIVATPVKKSFPLPHTASASAVRRLPACLWRVYNRYVSSLQFQQPLLNVRSQSFLAECTIWSLLSILNTERTCGCARIKLKVHNYLHSATGCAVNLSQPNAATQGKQCVKANMIGLLMAGLARGAGEPPVLLIGLFIYLELRFVCAIEFLVTATVFLSTTHSNPDNLLSNLASKFVLLFVHLVGETLDRFPSGKRTNWKLTGGSIAFKWTSLRFHCQLSQRRLQKWPPNSTLIGYSIFKVYESHDWETLTVEVSSDQSTGHCSDGSFIPKTVGFFSLLQANDKIGAQRIFSALKRFSLQPLTISENSHWPCRLFIPLICKIFPF